MMFILHSFVIGLLIGLILGVSLGFNIFKWIISRKNIRNVVLRYLDGSNKPKSNKKPSTSEAN